MNKSALQRDSVSIHAGTRPPAPPWIWSRPFGPLFIILAMLCYTPASAADWIFPPLHIGFSQKVLGDVNANDAMAAVKVWSKSIARKKEIGADPDPKIFTTVTEMAEALEQKTVDCISTTLPEYDALGGQRTDKNIVIGATSGSITEEYLLLVQRNSAIKRLRDLQGQTITLLHDSRSSIAIPWLAILLAKANLEPAGQFFKQIVPALNTGKAVLPVFFGQVAACLITRKGFEIMIELNPQTGERLRVLAKSPPVIPALFFFRTDYESPAQNLIMESLSRWHLDSPGKQILTLFQIDRLERHTVDRLDLTLKLLAEYRQLHPQSHRPPADAGAQKNMGETP